MSIDTTTDQGDKNISWLDLPGIGYDTVNIRIITGQLV
jgi:hypothetical protein